MLYAILGIFAILLTAVGMLFAAASGSSGHFTDKEKCFFFFISFAAHIVALLLAMAV